MSDPKGVLPKSNPAEQEPTTQPTLPDPVDIIADIGNRLVQWEILDAATWSQLLERTLSDPGKLLDALESDHILTRFQMERLMAGKLDSLRLDDYILLDKLGEGGMGSVYKARNLELGRIEAIKTMVHLVAGGDEMAQRFRREARVLARLEHPAIVPIYKVGTHEGIHFIAMKYVEGEDLRRRLENVTRAGHRLPVATVCLWMQQTASALQHAHENGIIHRDIKPGNLMLTSSEQIILLDLGIARLATGESLQNRDQFQTYAQRGLGTPPYMPPEQWADATRVTPASDIYALGCTFYQLLVGQVPFFASNMPALMRMHATAPIPLASSSRSDIPPGLDDIITAMLAKKPQDRFSSARGVEQALEPFAWPSGHTPGANLGSAIRQTPRPMSSVDVRSETSRRLGDRSSSEILRTRVGPEGVNTQQRQTRIPWKADVAESSGRGRLLWILLLMVLVAAGVAGVVYQEPIRAWVDSLQAGPVIAKQNGEDAGTEDPELVDATKGTGIEGSGSQTVGQGDLGDPKTAANAAVNASEIDAWLVEFQTNHADAWPNRAVLDAFVRDKLGTSTAWDQGRFESLQQRVKAETAALKNILRPPRVDGFPSTTRKQALRMGEALRTVFDLNAVPISPEMKIQAAFVDANDKEVSQVRVNESVFLKLDLKRPGYVTVAQLSDASAFLLPFKDRLQAGEEESQQVWVLSDPPFTFESAGVRRFLVVVTDSPLLPDFDPEQITAHAPGQMVEWAGGPRAFRRLESALIEGAPLPGATKPASIRRWNRTLIEIEAID